MSKQRKSVGIKILGWVIVVALATTPVVYFALQEPFLEVTAVAVARGPVEQTVAAIASGTVMPPAKSMLAAAGMGTIAAVHVEEGDRVEAGDVLVELHHEEFDAQVALAQANLKVGESRVQQARIAAKIQRDIAATRLSQAAAQLELAETDFERVKALYDKKAVSQSDFDKAILGLKVAREINAAAEAGQRENLVREEEIRCAEAALEQLEAGVQIAESMRNKAFARAPFAGVVARKILDVGEAVAMGLPLLHLVKTDDCYILAPFDEANANEIALGQEARIELDTYPEEHFSGEIMYIAPVVSINPNLSRTIDVKVRILTGAEKFMPGMSADVTIIADRKRDVLLAPSESLIRDEFVYVIQDGRAHRRDVTLGIGNWESREILGGIEEGETIITSVALKALAEGIKVQVVDELPGY